MGLPRVACPWEAGRRVVKEPGPETRLKSPGNLSGPIRTHDFEGAMQAGRASPCLEAENGTAASSHGRKGHDFKSQGLTPILREVCRHFKRNLGPLCFAPMKVITLLMKEGRKLGFLPRIQGGLGEAGPSQEGGMCAPRNLEGRRWVVLTERDPRIRYRKGKFSSPELDSPAAPRYHTARSTSNGRFTLMTIPGERKRSFAPQGHRVARLLFRPPNHGEQQAAPQPTSREAMRSTPGTLRVRAAPCPPMTRAQPGGSRS